MTKPKFLLATALVLVASSAALVPLASAQQPAPGSVSSGDGLDGLLGDSTPDQPVPGKPASAMPNAPRIAAAPAPLPGSQAGRAASPLSLPQAMPSAPSAASAPAVPAQRAGTAAMPLPVPAGLAQSQPGGTAAQPPVPGGMPMPAGGPMVPSVGPMGPAGPGVGPFGAGMQGPDSGPKQPPFEAATASVMSDEEANAQIQNLARKMRVYDAELKVEKVRGDIAKAQADAKKAMIDPATLLQSRLPTPQAMPAMPPSGAVPPPPVKKADDGEVHKDDVSTIWIAGPREALRAMVRVKGFGDVTVSAGGVLPGQIKVVAVESRGVTVKKGTGPSVLVPFLQ